jgi:hypothetical protein
MSDAWKKHDRACPPCRDCGTELYEKFWGNGGWAATEKATDKTHDYSDCVKVLRALIREVVTERYVIPGPSWRTRALRAIGIEEKTR